MILICSGNLIVGASFALAFWSYIPLYFLPIAIGAYLLKVPIEVCDRHQRPRQNRVLMNECSRREQLSGIRSLVMNIRYTSSRFRIGLFRTSGESRLGIAGKSRIEYLYVYLTHIHVGLRIYQNYTTISQSYSTTPS